MAWVRIYNVQLSPSAIAPGSSEQLFTVPGVRLGDFVAINKPTPQAGLGIGGARASADNQVGLTFNNDSGGSITPTAGEFYTALAVTDKDNDKRPTHRPHHDDDDD